MRTVARKLLSFGCAAALAALSVVAHVHPAAAAPVTGYTMVDLGTLGGSFAEAISVNSSGVVVGSSATADGRVHAFLWRSPGPMVDLGTLQGTAVGLYATEAGQVIGMSQGTNGHWRAFSWTAATGMVDLGTFGGEGRSSFLPGSPRFDTSVWGVSPTGTVFGVSATPSGRKHAFRWTSPGPMVDLMADRPNDEAADYYDGGIFGFRPHLFASPSTHSAGTITTSTDDRAFVVDETGSIRDLGTIAGPSRPSAVAYAANDLGAVVGVSANATPGGADVRVWNPDGSSVIVPSLFGSPRITRSGIVFGDLVDGTSRQAAWWSPTAGLLRTGVAGSGLSMNDAGVMVGQEFTTGRPFAWSASTGKVSLSTELGAANWINDAGVIVGQTGGRAVMWVPNAPADSDGDGVVDSLDVGVGAFADAIDAQPATTGSIVNVPSGLSLLVTDAPDPDGVEIAVSGTGSAKATVSVCGYTLRLAAGSDVVVTCGSIHLRVLNGSAEVVGAGMAVTFASRSAGVIDTIDGRLVVTSSTGAPPVMTFTDVTKPVITGAVSPAANANGWSNAPVTVSFACADELGGSGVASNTVAGATLSVDGAAQSVTSSGSCVDRAGNIADPATVSGINIDRSAPQITITGDVTYGPVDQVAVSCRSNDVLSGVAASTCPSFSGPASGFSVGVHTFVATATDRADNTTSATRSFTVLSGRQWFGSLASMLATLPLSGTNARNRDDAVEALREAAASSSWWTPAGAPSTSNGKKVFDALHDAVENLGRVSTSPIASQGAQALRAYARQQADAAIAAAIARSANPSKVAQAQQQLALGDRKFAQNEPGDGIDAYRNAWDKAVNA